MNCANIEASQCGQCKSVLQSKEVNTQEENSIASRMDVTLFREDEQFTFKNHGSSYVYQNGYSHSSKYDSKYDDLFSEACSMPKQMPKQIFEWEEAESPQPSIKIVTQDVVQTCELPVLNTNGVLTDHSLAQFIKPDGSLVEDFLSFDKLDPEIQNVLRLKAGDHPGLKKGRTASCSSDLLNTSFGSTDLSSFDITDYVFKDEQLHGKENHIKCESLPVGNDSGKAEDVKPPPVPPIATAVGIGRKKIDREAQKYIVDDISNPSEDEDEVDIETVSEEGSAPVLEAGSIEDLLIQFEATEARMEHENLPKVEIKTEMVVEKKPVISKPEAKPLKQDIKTQKRKLPQASSDNIKRPKKVEEQSINDQKLLSEKSTKLQVAKVMSKQNNKQIINALPQDLINRIKKESVKRKPITVIDPIPNIKKRGGAKVQQEATVKAKPASSQNTVILDHSYCMTDNSSSNSKCEKTVKKIQPICNQQSQNPINTVKDSGCTSSENDDKTVISMQPTVKNADGTLMVSLLKTNTIHKVESAQTNRKKLNLEEYKKRNGLVTSTSNSQGCSPKNSSPTPEEDTHQKMLRHQEKLRKMAEELLKTTPKSEQKKPEIEVPPVSSFEFKSPQDPPENIDPPYKLPAHLECKVFVSFGTNTDFRISKDQRDPLAPVAKLQEIKPLIDHVVKNTENSLISSVMETIPKLIEQSERPNKAMPQTEPDEEHGEFKRVVYMKKDRARCPTREVATQTNVSLIEQSKEKHTTSSARCSRKNGPRSGNSSTSSVSSRSSNHSYSSRPSPCCSGSSDYSSRSSSRLSFGRSRSRSPAYSSRSRNSNADEDHLNAVEERRIIYVGRISRNTTKDDLRRKFRKFGPINKISLHFRDIGENYGFVTFQFKEDAHAAYEHGNDDPAFPYYKISFGGRREFCKAAYSDLDDVRVLNRLNYYPYQHHQYQQQADESFDRLLKDHIYQLKKRKA